MKPLDQVVRDWIAPTLKEAGFTRQGRRFWLETQEGNLAFVWVRAFRLGQKEAEFFVELGVQPKVWLDFLERDGRPAGAALWSQRVLVPGRTPPMADFWAFDAADEATGELLATTLKATLPEALDMLAPRNILEYARTLPRPAPKIGVRPEIAQAALLAALGPSAELEQRLQALSIDRGDGWAPFDQEFVAFIRAWVADLSA